MSRIIPMKLPVRGAVLQYVATLSGFLGWISCVFPWYEVQWNEHARRQAIIGLEIHQGLIVGILGIFAVGLHAAVLRRWMPHLTEGFTWTAWLSSLGMATAGFHARCFDPFATKSKWDGDWSPFLYVSLGLLVLHVFVSFAAHVNQHSS